ncbi:MAG: TrkH family potassium uptake protein [Bacilli bacterium]|nr:TrkH family potassium uptake protein [Bacilli bacterium]
MRNKLIYKYIGKVLIGYSFLLLIPFIVGMFFKELSFSFLLCAGISLVLGLLLNLFKTYNTHLYARDGFKIVTLSWIFISLIGSVPIMLETNSSFINSLFEAVSGLTTTGATVFSNPEVLSKSILFWRDFMHFIGGMGVLAFVMAIIPLAKNDKSMYLLKAEMPGPVVSKLVPSIKKTLYLLYGIYFTLTITELILLLLSGVSFFDSLLLAMGTAGTGGFSPLASSVATYPIAAKIIIAVYMFLFGVNFNIYFLIIFKNFKNALKSEELRVYVGLYLFTVFLLVINSLSYFGNLNESLLHAFFNTSSFMSSTGYGIGDVNIYPTICRVWILFIMVVSACAGSTCGGFKISRLILIFKSIKRDIQKIVHPNSISSITFEGKVVDEETLQSTKSFMFLYILLILVILFVVSLDGFSFETSLNAVFTTFGNVGLYFEIPNFEMFSSLSKVFMSFGMLLGRLEIYPIIALILGRRK